MFWRLFRLLNHLANSAVAGGAFHLPGTLSAPGRAACFVNLPGEVSFFQPGQIPSLRLVSNASARTIPLRV